MSRQTERADARRQAKIDKANERKPGSYPASRDVPFLATGKTYPRSSKREAARHAGVTLQAAA